jgi:hypothetical protein
MAAAVLTIDINARLAGLEEAVQQIERHTRNIDSGFHGVTSKVEGTGSTCSICSAAKSRSPASAN